MSTTHSALSEQYLSALSRRRKKHVDDDTLKFLESSLQSIKAEMAAGTPIDPQLVEEMERRIKRLRDGSLF